MPVPLDDPPASSEDGRKPALRMISTNCLRMHCNIRVNEESTAAAQSRLHLQHAQGRVRKKVVADETLASPRQRCRLPSPDCVVPVSDARVKIARRYALRAMSTRLTLRHDPTWKTEQSASWRHRQLAAHARMRGAVVGHIRTLEPVCEEGTQTDP